MKQGYEMRYETKYETDLANKPLQKISENGCHVCCHQGPPTSTGFGSPVRGIGCGTLAVRIHEIRLSTPLGSKAALMMLRSMCGLSEHLCRSYRKLLNVPAWTGSAERRRTQVPRVEGPSALSRQRVPARLRRNPDSLRLHGCG